MGGGGKEGIVPTVLTRIVVLDEVFFSSFAKDKLNGENCSKCRPNGNDRLRNGNLSTRCTNAYENLRVRQQNVAGASGCANKMLHVRQHIARAVYHNLIYVDLVVIKGTLVKNFQKRTIQRDCFRTNLIFLLYNPPFKIISLFFFYNFNLLPSQLSHILFINSCFFTLKLLLTYCKIPYNFCL